MLRQLLATALAASLLVGCGGDDAEDAGGIVDTEVAEVLAEPDDFDEVRLEGEGSPLGSEAFVLAEDGAEILVYSTPPPALRVDDGDRVTVIGSVMRLERHQVDRIRDEAQRGGGRLGSIDRAALEAVSPEVGEPYVSLINVRDEGGND